MGDNRRIDMLRALALSSMPSVSRRPMQRQNSLLTDVTEARKYPVSLLLSKSNDKEEGELSSDDEAQCSSTPFPPVEPSLSIAHINAALSLYAPSQGNLKDERHTPAAVSSESVPPIGVPRASVFSPSTRVSIVNKSQLLSAFTAQAPPLKSFQRPKPAQKGSGLRVTEKKSKKKLPQVIPSGAGLGNRGSGHESSPSSVGGISIAAPQAKSTELDLFSLQESCSTLRSPPITNASELRSSGEPLLQLPAEISSVILTSSDCPVPLTSDPLPAVGPVTSSGGSPGLVPAGQLSTTSAAVAHGLELSRATGIAASVSATPGIGGVVRKEADAFLASLRIPVVNSSHASGDEKEDAFLIKFDEDSDSDGVENVNQPNLSSKHSNKSLQKRIIGSSGPLNSNVLSLSAPVMPNQSPSDLKAEIDRMKKQIAAMERTKIKTSTPSILGKSSKVSTDNSRMGASAAETKSGLHSGVTSARPAPVDLESMRLRIAAKENELLQRRQRLSIKGPESGKGVSDLKGTSGCVASSTTQVFKPSHSVEISATHGVQPVGKASEKSILGYKQARADGIPALALAGPSGVNLLNFKKDIERRGLDGSSDPQNLKSQFTGLGGATNGSEAAGHQSVARGMKRSLPGGELGEIVKVPRLDNGFLSEKSGLGDLVTKEVPVSHAIPSKAISTCMPAAQTSNLPKRKVDSSQASSGPAISFMSPTGLETSKKLKTSAGILPMDAAQNVMAGLLAKSQSHAPSNGQQRTQILSPLNDELQSSIRLARDQGNSASNKKASALFVPSLSESLKTTAPAVHDSAHGAVGSREVGNSVSLSLPLPVVSENWGSLIAVQRSHQDILTSSIGSQSIHVNGGSEALGAQQARQGFTAYHGPASTARDSALTSGLTQPVVKVRHDERTACCTTMTFTKEHPKTQGISNVNDSLFTENHGLQATLSWRPVNPVSIRAPTNLEHQVRHSVLPGYSRIDDEQLDAEHDSFQQLEEEEKLLDKEIEEARQNRQRCELREQAVRKEYRDAQWALRAANADCDNLNQRRELLLSRIHTAEARHYSIKSSVTRPVVSFRNTLITHHQSIDERPAPLDNGPYPVPVAGQAADGLCERNVNGDQDHFAHALENLSPLSSNRGDIPGLVHREAQAQLNLSAEGTEDYSSCMFLKTISDGKGDKLALQMIAGGDCGRRREDDEPSGEKHLERDTVCIGRNDALETDVVVNIASRTEADYSASCHSGLNTRSLQKVCSADLENCSLGMPTFTAENENGIGRSMCSSDLRGNGLPESKVMEIKEAVLQDASKQCTAVVHMDVDHSLARLGEISEVLSENDSHPDYSRSNGLMVVDEQLSGRNLEHVNLEQLTVLTACHDIQSVDSGQSIRDMPSPGQGLDCTGNQDILNVRDASSPAQHVDCNNTRDVVDVEEGNLQIDGLGQDDSLANIRDQDDFHDSVRLTDNNVCPTINFCDGHVQFKADTPSFSTPIVRKVVGQVEMPERPLVAQQETVWEDSECEVAKVSSATNDKGDSEMLRLRPCDTALSHDISLHGVLAVTGAEQGLENINLIPSPIDPDGWFSLSASQQPTVHLSHTASDPQIEIERNTGDGDFSKSGPPPQACADTEAGVGSPIMDLPMSPSLEHSKELEEVHATNSTCHNIISSGELQSAVATHDPASLDMDIHHRDNLNSREGIPGVRMGKVELLTLVSQSKIYNGISVAESQDFVSVQSFREPLPGAMHNCSDDPLTRLHKHGKPPLEERILTVSNFMDKDGCRSRRPEDPAEGILNSVREWVDDNCVTDSISGVVYSETDDTAEGGADDLSKDAKMITDDMGANPGVEVQEQEISVNMEVQDHQQDLLTMNLSISRELESEKKESENGAEVEVFRKALLDGNVFERRSSSGEVRDTTMSPRQSRDEVSEQILPRLQHHRLEHLLDMVEVQTPEFSVGGGDALVQEELQGSKCGSMPHLVEAVLPDPPILESHKSFSAEQAQVLDGNIAVPLSTPREIACAISENRVQPSVALVVHGCSPTDESQCLNFDSLEFVNVGSDQQTSSGATIVPCRYESPLSMFRSYRKSPQFSSALRLSSHSSTWSHAINPFKPLCKFEHRGKCNNDDCPWQHTDDYTLSSSQPFCQEQNFVDSSGLNSNDHCLSVTCVNNGADAVMAARSATLDSSVTEVCNPQLGGGLKLANSSTLHGSLPLKSSHNEALVPVYRSGSYTLRGVDPTSISLHPYSLHLDRKVDSFHSFLLSPSIHRLLPADMPCLLDSSKSLSILSDATAFGTESSHWRYMAEMPNKLVFTKDGFFEELVDEEVWMEMALHHIDFDISTDNFKARDQALFILSRALESKPTSVPLWVAYSCLFHTRKDNPEKDDMFRHAVQYNQCSYELWVLYINSRPDIQSRLESYEKALVALVYGGTQAQIDEDELSACLLDIGLQMLYCMCISGRNEDLFLWLEDLICDATVHNDREQHRDSTAALLSHLSLHDACVLWVACTYFSACGKFPTGIIARLGCKQELPYRLDWEKHAKADEVSHKRVIKMLRTATSTGQGCLSLETPHMLTGCKSKDQDSRHVLGINYLQCLAFYEGLDSAALMGCQLRNLYPTSLDLILVCASIDERRSGPSSGLHIFEEALLQWPLSYQGILCLWNQYARHALLWVGKGFAKDILLKCVTSAELHSSGQELTMPHRFPKPRERICKVGLDGKECTACEQCSTKRWGHLRDDLVNFTSMEKTNHHGTINNYESSQVEDSVFALINLALVESISGDLAASQLAINRAMKAAISHKNLRNCWRELSALNQVLSRKCTGWEDYGIYEPSTLSLLDRCKTDSHILSQLKPLSHKSFENFRKPFVRKFIEDLVGPAPLDHSILNSILDVLYGPELLPSGSYSLKEIFCFAEGILEAMPGNVPLASSLCKMVEHHGRNLKRAYKSAAVWASALFTSALHQSCPLAPEIYWVEAGLLLRQVGEARSLEEFYLHALLHHPFSVALQDSLQDVRNQLQMADPLSQVSLQKGLNVMVPGPVQVGVEC